MNDELLTIQEASDFLGVSTKTLRRWEARGVLIPARTVGNQRRYTIQELQDFKLTGRQTQPAYPTEQQSVPMQLPVSETASVSPASVNPPQLSPPQQFVPSTYHETPTASDVHVSSTTVQDRVQVLQQFFQKNKRASYLPYALAGIIIIAGLFLVTSYGPIKKVSPLALTNGASGINWGKESSVLAAQAKGRELFGEIEFFIPAIFNQKVTINKDFVVNGKSLFNEDIKVNNKNVDLGSGKVTASNLVYGLTAGANISITGNPQNPTISVAGAEEIGGVKSFQGQTGIIALTKGDGIGLNGLTITNTGVLSLGGQTGAVTLTAGDGIAVSGTEISNDDPGSSQNIFKNILVDATTIIAGSNNDTLTFAQGSGISITPDATTKKLTFAATFSSQWTTTGSNIYYNTGNVGIGTTTPSSALDVSGNASVSGTVGIGSLGQGIVHANSTGVLSSSPLDLAGGATEITGLLPVTRGGIGIATTPSAGQLLIGNGSTYDLANLTGTANQITISNAPGSITFYTPQDIHTGATPSFAALNIPSNTDQIVLGTGLTNTLTMEPLSNNRTITFPDASGIICLSSGNCGSGGGGGTIVGSGTTNYIVKFTSATGISDSLLYEAGGKLGLGTTSPQGLFNVSGAPAGQSLAILNYTGSGENILVGSSSGTTRFAFDASGNLNLVSGDYQAGGANVLNATTLGATVVTSSLVTVGTLGTGSIGEGFGNIDVGNDSISGGNINAASGVGFTATGSGSDLTFNGLGLHDILASSGTLRLGAVTLIGDITGNLQSITGVDNITASGTVTFSGLETGVVLSNGSGQLSSGALNLADGAPYITGSLPVTNGGTGLSSVTTGQMLYASGNNTLAALPIGSSGQVLSISGGVPAWTRATAFNYLQRNEGALSPINIADDFLVGGSSTSSAKFQISGQDGSASSSGNVTFNTAASIQTTSNQSLTLGGDTTGNIILSPQNGNGTVNSTGHLNLSSGKEYRINGTSVLSASALGTNVISSSLTSVGALAGGSIASGFGSIVTTNNITGNDINATGNIRTGAGTIRINDTGNLVNIGSTQLNSVTYVWPGSDGSNEYVLTTNGAGDLSWSSVSGINGAGDITAIGDVTSGAAFTASGTQGTSLYFYDADGRGQLTNANLTAARTYTLPDESGDVCLTSGNCAGVGGNMGGTGTAGQIAYFSGTGSIESETAEFAWDATNNKLGIGTDAPTGKVTVSGASSGQALVVLNETGNQDILTASASGTTMFALNRSGDIAIEGSLSDISNDALIINDDLNLVPGNTFQINSADVLSATALGMTVTSSSLTTVSALTNGSIANGFGSIATLNVIEGSSLTANGSGGGLTFTGTGNHDIAASNGILRTGALTLNGAITGNAQHVTGLGDLSAAGTITLNSFISNGGILYTNGTGQVAQVTAGTSTQILKGGTAPSFGSVILTSDVSGILPIANGGTNTGTLGLSGSVAYSNGTNYTFSSVGSNGQVLISNGADAPSWTDAVGVGTNYWQRNAGAVAPVVITDDLIIGAASAASAKFQISGVTGNASTSGNMTFNSVAQIQSTKNQTLTFGGNTTGNVALAPGGTTALTALANGNVGIGTTTPQANLQVAGGDILIDNNTYFTQFNSTGTQYSILGVGNDNHVRLRAANGSVFINPDNNEPTFLNFNNSTAVQVGDGITATDLHLAKGSLGIGTTSPLATLDIYGQSGITPIASFSGQTSNVGLFVDNNGTGDLFTAAKSGATKFTILNSGDIRINNLANCTALETNASGLVSCGSDEAGGSVNYWQLTDGTVSPFSSTADLLVGGTATNSAKFAFINSLSGTPTASIAGAITNNALYLTGDGTIATTNRQTLSLGSTSTGVLALTGSRMQFTNLAGCDTIDTDANGFLTCGSDAGGSGGAGIINVQNNGVGVGTVDTLDFNSQFLVSTSPSTTAHVAIANNALNFAEFSDTLNLDGATSIALSNDDFTLGTNAGNGGIVVAPNAGGKSALIINKQGSGDIFTASASGTTRLTLSNGGNLNLIGGVYQSGGSSGVTVSSAGCVTSVGGIVTGTAACPVVAANDIWKTGSGAIYQGNATQDFLIGSTASSSAKFAVLNVNSGTPSASVSGATGGTYLTADGTLQTTARQTLMLGGNTTGNIVAANNVNATNGLDVTGADLTVGGTNASITTAGVINGTSLQTGSTTRLDNSGNLSNIGTIGSTYLSTSTNVVNLAASTALNFNGTTVINASRQFQNIAGVATHLNPTAANTYDLGTGTGDQYREINGQTLYQNGNQVCDMTGNCAGLTTTYWNQNNGAVSTKNSTVDFLVGGIASSSAKFAVLNVNSGIPSASVSGATGGSYLTAAGTLQTTNNQTLNIGGNTTGNIVINSNTGTITLADATTISGNLNVSSSLQTGSTTRLDNSGNLSNIGTIGSTYLSTSTNVVNLAASTALNFNGTTVINASRQFQNIAGVATHLNPTAANTYDLGTGTGDQYREINGQTLYQNGNQVCDMTGNCAGLTTTYWNQNNGAVSTKNSTVDFLVGGIASSSAKFAVLNVNSGIPSASVSGATGGIYLTANGTLQTTAKQAITIGGGNSGNVVLDGFVAGIVQTNASGVLSSGTASVGVGGTGATTFTAGGVLYGNGAGSLAANSQGTAGQVLLSGGAGAPTWTTGTLALGVGLITTGTNPLTLTTTGSTTATFPTGTITLADTASTQTLSGKTLTTPRFADLGYLADANGNELLILNSNASAVNEITIANATTTTSPTLAATGGDTNIALSLDGKGTGDLNLNNTGTGNILLGGGSGATGCTVTNATGAFACTAALSGSNFSGSSSGTNTGDQTITLTGDVTGSGNGSFATTIADNSVDGTDISLTSEAQGNVMYYDGTNWVRLANGTANQVLHSGATNPSWSAISLTGDVSGTLPIANGGTNGTANPTAGGVSYGTGSAYAFTGQGSTGNCLVSNGISAPSWGSCAGGVTNYWQQTGGTVSPYSNTLDVLIGGVATSSAKFAFINTNTGSGIPTASISAQTGTMAALVLGANSTIQSVKNQTLTLGGATTGNILLNPNNGTGGFVNIGGNVNVASGFAYQIAGVNVLAAGTLGTTITASSLDSVDQLNAGSISSGFGAIDIGSDNITGGNIIATGTTGFTGSGAGAGLTLSGSGTHIIQASGGTLQINAFTMGGLITGGGNNITGLGLLSVDTLQLEANTLSATGDLILNAAGGDIIFANNNTINIGGSGSDTAYNAIGDNLALASTRVDSDDDLYIEGNFEVDGIISTVDIRGTLGTTPNATISGKTSHASLVVDNSGNGDLFTASSSGLSRFVIKQNGNVGMGVTNPISGAKLQVAGGDIVIDNNAYYKALNASGTAYNILGLGNDNNVRLFSAGGGIYINPDQNSPTNLNFNNSSAVQVGDGYTATNLYVAKGALGVGTTNPSATLDIRGNSGTTPIASFSGQTSNVGLFVDNNGTGDLFTAAKSGKTHFTIRNSGAVVIGNTTNGITFDATNPDAVYSGSSRPNKKIILSAEYPGAVLTASVSAGTNHTGYMTADASASAALSNFLNYYEWTTDSTQGTLQDYTVAVRVTLPHDFGAWQTTNAITIKYNTELGGNGSNKLDILLYNATTGLNAVPVAYYQSQSTTAKTWTDFVIDDSDLTNGTEAWDTAGKTAVFYLKMYSRHANHVQVGDITLNYLGRN